MSKALYTNYKDVPGVPEGEQYEDEAYEYMDEDEGEAERVGLFSTPARAITLGFSVLLLFAVVVIVAWLIGQGQPKNNSSLNAVSDPNSEQSYHAPSSSKLKPVPDINNPNASYTSKPAGLSEAPKVGALPPNFQWNDQKTGQPVTLESLRGKPVLINFWGTWCPPCRAEMPEMQKIYDREKGNMTFLGVSMGPRDEPLGVAQFVQLGPYTWDFVHDPNGDVMQRYQVTGIPSSYFIDKSGVIRAIHVGGADAQIIEDNLKKATNSQ